MAKKKPIPYFAEKEEQGVITYITTDSKEVKDRVYNNILIEPFRKMIESILRRYPIHIGNYEMEEIESNALSHLIDHMIKYRPYIIQRRLIDYDEPKWYKLGEEYRFFDKEDAYETLDELNDFDDKYEYTVFRSKAFSYCQTIIRNYYRDHGRKSYGEKKTNLSFDDYYNEDYECVGYIENQNEENNLEDLIKIVVNKIKDLINNDPDIKENEVLVGDAIINVLENWNVLFMEDSPFGVYNKKVTSKYAKNKVLLFLKEQTGLSTKEIRVGSKLFKDIYYLEKIQFYED